MSVTTNTNISGVGGANVVGTSPVSGGGAPSSPTPKWDLAIKKMKAGTRNARLLNVGDSTTAGSYAAGNAFVGAKPFSYPTQLAPLLAARGYPVSTSSMIGTSVNSTSIGLFTGYDTQWAVGAGWACAAVNTCGGGTLNNSGAGNLTAANYAPATAFDTVDIWYIQNTAYGSFTIGVDGGAALGSTVVAAGGLSIQKVTRTTALGVHTLNITKVADGNILICGVSCYNSQQKCIEVMNAGWGGATTALWAAAVAVWDPANMLAVYAPDLTIINLGINDWLTGVLPATYSTNIEVLIAKARLSGDVAIMTGAPSAIGSASQAVQDGITQVCRALAEKYNCPLIDVSGEWGNYVTAADAINGFYAPAGDPVHPGAVGYGDVARLTNAAL